MMAELNGISSHQDSDTIAIASSHLGKRKRTASPEPTTPSEKTPDFATQTKLNNILPLIRKYDTVPSLLTFPLPPSAFDSPSAKKARIGKAESTSGTIEHRLLTGSYNSFESLLEDVKIARAALLEEIPHSNVNGQARPGSPSEVDLKEQSSGLVNYLTKYLRSSEHAANGDLPVEDVKYAGDNIKPNPRMGHVLSLRAQANGQAQYLYTGLQKMEKKVVCGSEGENDTESNIEGLALPNGFELTDFAALNGGVKPQKLAPRNFGQVFGIPTNGRGKLLEEPRPSKNYTRSTTLRLVPSSGLLQNNTHTKNDQKHNNPAIGAWVTYGAGAPRASSQSVTGDYQSGHLHNDTMQPARAADSNLFSSVYSSFAPTSDNSASVISAEVSGQQWWHKYGARELSKVFSSKTGPKDLDGQAETQGLENFDNVLANWISADDQTVSDANNEKVGKEADDNDGLLEEVSDLIETLSSYQRNRNLNASGRVPEISGSEFDTFEMLRTQLSLLVSGLPPFAVAKLNGDQLEELNISTRLLVATTEYAGTGQVDEYELKSQRANIAGPATINRTIGPTQARPTHLMNLANTPGYNIQARSYNASVPATAAYGMRSTTNYQTPTAARPAYPQTPYQAQGTPFNNRATIQQYQRQLQNGLGGYANNQTTPGFTSRPNQPVHQSRAPESLLASIGRSASPQKPMINGQGYSPRPTQQTQYPFQRAPSGAPATPSYTVVGGSGPARYDGAVDSTKNEVGGGAVERPVPAPSLSPAVGATPINQSQTVEVSR